MRDAWNITHREDLTDAMDNSDLALIVYPAIATILLLIQVLLGFWGPL